jgi:hypothetical protein
MITRNVTDYLQPRIHQADPSLLQTGEIGSHSGADLYGRAAAGHARRPMRQPHRCPHSAHSLFLNHFSLHQANVVKTTIENDAVAHWNQGMFYGNVMIAFKEEGGIIPLCSEPRWCIASLSL